MSGGDRDGPRLLVTGFGPFPNAPENPTEALVRALGRESPEAFGAAALRAVVLPTDYRRSWAVLRRIYSGFRPDVVVHFGLSRGAEALKLESSASRRVDPDRPDAAGWAPPSGYARRSGPDQLATTMPFEPLLGVLAAEGIPAEASHDAGRYVCNATLYRSLLAADGSNRLVGFVHVPPDGVAGFTEDRLAKAARLLLQTACRGLAEVGSSARMARRRTCVR